MICSGTIWGDILANAAIASTHAASFGSFLFCLLTNQKFVNKEACGTLFPLNFFLKKIDNVTYDCQHQKFSNVKF